MTVDVSTLIGPYPFRYVPHPDPEILVRVLEREGLDGAWVGHLPAAWHRDPRPSNIQLATALAPFASVLAAVPTVRPGWPGWMGALEDAARAGAPAIRVYPTHWGIGAHHELLASFTRACGELGLVVLLTTRFEDLRQRHTLDVAGDLQGATIRTMARASTAARLVVTAAGRELLEEVHWGLTPDEQSRCYWDFSWIWGPPEDHLALLFRTVGAERFTFGTQWPLRLTQGPRANLDLLPDDVRGAAIADAATILRDARAAAAR